MSAQQAKAILYGLALGDALGAPTEFITLDEIRNRYGERGIQEPPTPALYTDDTQMTLALAEALIDSAGEPVETFMVSVGREFVRWLHSPENNRAPGNASMQGVRRFADGVAWREAGGIDAKGCGSAMRVAPIGYLYQANLDRLREVAEASSQITHRHSAAIVSSVAAAYLIKLALDQVSPDEYLGRLYALTEGISNDYDQALHRVGHVQGWGDEVAAMHHIGQGWVAEEAVALALYCVLRYPDSYVDVVRRGANSDGDSDSIASIAGGVVAARLGLQSIPAGWIERCEKRDYIADVAERLAVKRHQLGVVGVSDDL